MTAKNTNQQTSTPNHGYSSSQGNYDESNSMATDGRIIGYNMDEDQRPDGIKVRFKINIVTGKHAAALDERQAEAIRELLQWTRQQRTRSAPPSR